jgi:hypothetical protein
MLPSKNVKLVSAGLASEDNTADGSMQQHLSSESGHTQRW